MPELLIKFLILVFIVHFIAFVRLAYVRREKRYILVSITFLLLVGSFSSRLWFQNVRISSISLHWFLRIGAWFFAAVAISMLIKDKFFSPKQNTAKNVEIEFSDPPTLENNSR